MTQNTSPGQLHGILPAACKQTQMNSRGHICITLVQVSKALFEIGAPQLYLNKLQSWLAY